MTCAAGNAWGDTERTWLCLHLGVRENSEPGGAKPAPPPPPRRKERSMETLTRRLLAVLCLAALCLTGCGAASSAGTATPETAAATPETAVPALAGR